MKRLNVGDKFKIQCYKHNGNVHRFWEEAIIIDIQKDYIVCANNHTLVIESDGSTRKTREPAVMYFFKNKWYNIIAQLKKDGISYYCNIATPYLIEDDTIKYIDYDLDLRIYASGEYKILDRAEYNYHKKIMKYSSDLDVAVNNGLDELIKLYKNGSKIFCTEYNLAYYNEYTELIENN